MAINDLEKCRNKGVLVFTYFSFNDPLIQTYTLPYVKLIRKNLPIENSLILVCLEKESTFLTKDALKLKEEGIEIVWYKYKGSGSRAALSWFGYFYDLKRIIKLRKVGIVHAWCTPAGAFAYILSVLSGKKLIIDSYEPHAEAMVENGTWPKGNLLFKILFLLEKLQTKRAKVLISATEGMEEYSKRKYGAKLHEKKFYVKPACVNLEMFSYKNIKNRDLIKRLKLNNKIVCVYAGKFGGIYQVHEVFHFFKVASKYWGEKFRILLLTGHNKNEIINWSKHAGLDHSIITITRVNHKDIPNYIGLGDFAITPVKPVPTKRYCTPIKDGEYWALGLPVVIPEGISDDSGIIEKYDIGAVLNGLNNEEYLKAIKKIDVLLKQNTREELYQKIRRVAEKYRNFTVAEKIYEEIYG